MSRQGKDKSGEFCITVHPGETVSGNHPQQLSILLALGVVVTCALQDMLNAFRICYHEDFFLHKSRT